MTNQEEINIDLPRLRKESDGCTQNYLVNKLCYSMSQVKTAANLKTITIAELIDNWTTPKQTAFLDSVKKFYPKL